MKKKNMMRSPSGERVCDRKVKVTTRSPNKKSKHHRKHHVTQHILIQWWLPHWRWQEARKNWVWQCYLDSHNSNKWEGNRVSILFLGMTGYKNIYRVSKETGGATKNHVIITRRRDLDGDIGNAAVKLRITEADQSPVIAHARSHTDTVTSLGQGAQAAPSGRIAVQRALAVFHP